MLKINHGVISPAHTLAPALEESLGFSVPQEGVSTPQQCWERWLANPVSCTPAEIDSGMKWAYINNAMTSEQEALYEKQSLEKL